MKHNKAFPASKANFVLTSEALAIYAFNLKKYSFFHIWRKWALDAIFANYYVNETNNGTHVFTNFFRQSQIVCQAVEYLKLVRSHKNFAVINVFKPVKVSVGRGLLFEIMSKTIYGCGHQNQCKNIWSKILKGPFVLHQFL